MDSPGNKVIYCESNKSEYIVPIKGLGIQSSIHLWIVFVNPQGLHWTFQNNRIHLDSPGNKVMYCENNENEILSLYEA